MVDANFLMVFDDPNSKVAGPPTLKLSLPISAKLLMIPALKLPMPISVRSLMIPALKLPKQSYRYFRPSSRRCQFPQGYWWFLPQAVNAKFPKVFWSLQLYSFGHSDPTGSIPGGLLLTLTALLRGLRPYKVDADFHMVIDPQLYSCWYTDLRVDTSFCVDAFPTQLLRIPTNGWVLESQIIVDLYFGVGLYH